MDLSTLLMYGQPWDARPVPPLQLPRNDMTLSLTRSHAPKHRRTHTRYVEGGKAAGTKASKETMRRMETPQFQNITNTTSTAVMLLKKCVRAFTRALGGAALAIAVGGSSIQ